MGTEKPKSLPKTIQVSEMLIREIAAGRYPDGSRLPTERKMAENLGVAVGTLRRALAILEERGLLRRVQGSGNYVQSKTDVQSVYEFFRLELLEGGGMPTADILEVQRLKKGPDIPEIGPGTLAHRIRRLRYLDVTPVEVEEIWLDGRFADWVVQDELRDSLYYYYKEKLKVVIASVTDNVGVSVVPDWAPKEFNLTPGKPCGLVERISYDLSGETVEYSRNWFNHEVCRYTNRLGKRQAS
ncbi:MAG: GntR family transcriptional regulator [Pseudomonadota bacterium]